MPEYIDEGLLEDQDTDTDLMRQMRKQLRDAHAEIKRRDAESRSSNLSKALTDAGVADPAGVAKFYPKDGDASREAVDAWLKGDGSVFKTAAGGETTTAPQTQQTTTDQQQPATPAGLPQELIAAWQAMQRQEQAGSPGVTPIGPDRVRADLNALEGKDFDEVMAALNAIGTVPLS